MFFRRTSNDVLVAALEERIKRLERQQDELNQDIKDLGEKHLKLRGKIYALKMHKPEAEEVPRTLTRDDLRRSLVANGRFTPGKPVKHD